MRERGLKCKYAEFVGYTLYVAPYAGAWIEIFPTNHGSPSIIVAPYAGAWIEIVIMLFLSLSISSRSLCGSVD